MSALPLELHFVIIQHITTAPDLHSLALCCSAFRDEAQRGLFFHPRISTRSQQHKFIDTIIGSPIRLARFVHVYRHLSGREVSGVPGGTHAEVALALRSMCNLKELSFSQTQFFPQGILDGCTFKLNVFHWGSWLLRGYLVQYILETFLPTQPTLRHLAIRRLGEPVPSNESPPLQAQIISALFPILESLSGEKNVVNVLLQNGRSIKRLQWIDTELPALTASQVERLEHLELLRCNFQRNAEAEFVGRLTSLLVLDLIVEDVKFASSLQRLNQIPKLRILIVRKSPVTPRTLWQQSTSPQTLGHIATVQKFFQESKSVERVFVQKLVGSKFFDEVSASKDRLGRNHRTVDEAEIRLLTRCTRLE